MEVCKICGKSFSRLATHLTKSHDISLEEYRKLYSDSIDMNKVDVLKDDKINFSTYSNDIDFRDLPNPYDIKISTPTSQMSGKPDNITPLTASQQEKAVVLNLIKEKYSDAEKDYFINLGLGGILAVDFASPVEKIVFNFPNAFWHNQNLYFNERVLNDNKWKVFNYYSLQDFIEEFSS